MPAPDLSTSLLAAGCVAGGIAAALLLRTLFRAFARRATRTSGAWDDLGWALLGSLSMPFGVVGGLWAAVAVLRPAPSVRDFIDRILLTLIMLGVAHAVARLAGDIVRSFAATRAGTARSATIFAHVVKIVIVAIGILVLLQSLGIPITPVLTALGVGGLAVALALQDTLSNLFAGVQVLASNKIQPGDYVQLDSGDNGVVVDINWRNTTIEQLSGNVVIVPNSKMADAIIVNYHRPVQDMAILVGVGVGYDSDLEQVEQVTIEVANEVMRSVKGSVPEHEPFVRFHTFGEYSIDFNVILRVSEYRDQYLIVHEFIKCLHRRYAAEGIEIPYPIRTVQLDSDHDRPKPDRRPSLTAQDHRASSTTP